jgi:hypothetical protein
MAVHGLKSMLRAPSSTTHLEILNSSSILIVEYVVEWVVSDDNNRVLLEVAPQLPRGDEHCIE